MSGAGRCRAYRAFDWTESDESLVQNDVIEPGRESTFECVNLLNANFVVLECTRLSIA